MSWTTERVLEDMCWARSRTWHWWHPRWVLPIWSTQAQHVWQQECHTPMEEQCAIDSQNNESYYQPLPEYHGISLEDSKQPGQCPE